MIEMQQKRIMLGWSKRELARRSGIDASLICLLYTSDAADIA